LKTCRVYKVVLQTIKVTNKIPLRVSELVAGKHTSTKLDWT
jgi:hypothetical protein